MYEEDEDLEDTLSKVVLVGKDQEIELSMIGSVDYSSGTLSFTFPRGRENALLVMLRKNTIEDIRLEFQAVHLEGRLNGAPSIKELHLKTSTGPFTTADFEPSKALVVDFPIEGLRMK